MFLLLARVAEHASQIEGGLRLLAEALALLEARVRSDWLGVCGNDRRRPRSWTSRGARRPTFPLTREGVLHIVTHAALRGEVYGLAIPLHTQGSPMARALLDPFHMPSGRVRCQARCHFLVRPQLLTRG
jgi:hypothetical protein